MISANKCGTCKCLATCTDSVGTSDGKWYRVKPREQWMDDIKLWTGGGLIKMASEKDDG